MGYGADTTRQKFTGYEKDTESDLDFAQARYYNSKHGRFTSVDPLMASAQIRNPKTWNRYSYALNNPLRFVDPTGLKPCDKDDPDCIEIDSTDTDSSDDAPGCGGKTTDECAKYAPSPAMMGFQAPMPSELTPGRVTFPNQTPDTGAPTVAPLAGAGLVLRILGPIGAVIWLSEATMHGDGSDCGGGYACAPETMVQPNPADNSPTQKDKDDNEPPGMFRGGSSMTPKPGELRIRDGLVQPLFGPSVNTDKRNRNIVNNGGPYRVGQPLPDGLMFRRQGQDPGHHMVVPTSPMREDRYLQLLKRIVLTPEPL